jgi:two-component system cell cycle response regulator
MKDLDPKMQIEYDVCLDKEKLLHNSKFLIITTDQYVDEYDVLFYDANIEYQIVTQSYYEKIIYDFKPDIVILDGRISEDFLAIASQLLHNDNTKDIPILLIFQLMQFDIIEKALSMGVQDYVTIPVDQNELFARSIILLCRNKYHKLLKLRYSDILSDANIDPLTKLNTRSFFEKKVTKMLSQLVTTAVLLIIDIDEFKSINDRFGHKAGDIALITIATIIQQNIKVTDIVCRLGGEEFLVYLHNSTLQDAEIVAARLIDAIAKAPITFNDINNNYCIIYCTCSIGGKYITCQQPINAFNCFSDLLIKADQNLYIVKRKEKNDYLIN